MATAGISAFVYSILGYRYSSTTPASCTCSVYSFQFLRLVFNLWLPHCFHIAHTNCCMYHKNVQKTWGFAVQPAASVYWLALLSNWRHRRHIYHTNKRLDIDSTRGWRVNYLQNMLLAISHKNNCVLSLFVFIHWFEVLSFLTNPLLCWVRPVLLANQRARFSSQQNLNVALSSLPLLSLLMTNSKRKSLRHVRTWEVSEVMDR